MPQISEGQAAGTIKGHPVGIGEDHTKPEGRKLALRLIDGGGVKRLFVESPSSWGQTVIDNAASKGNLSDKVTALAGLSVMFSNEVSLAHVIATAQLKGVPVIAADITEMTRSGGGSMDKRNNAIAAKVRETVGQNFAGALLLWGGAHFEGKGSLGERVPDLHWVMAG